MGRVQEGREICFSSRPVLGSPPAPEVQCRAGLLSSWVCQVALWREPQCHLLLTREKKKQTKQQKTTKKAKPKKKHFFTGLICYWKLAITCARTLGIHLTAGRVGSVMAWLKGSLDPLARSAWGMQKSAVHSTLLHHVSQGLSGRNSRWSSSISQ